MAGPDVIMFIRHGEKPGDDGTPKAIDHHGEQDEHSLIVRGWTRAGALAALFSHLPSFNYPGMVTPRSVYATKSTDDYRSKREVHTARPTAKRLGLSVNDAFDHGQVTDLVASIMGDDRPPLVVWHHGSLVDVLAHFPIANRGDIPSAWPEDRFDLIWTLSKAAGEPEYRFAAVPQQLLDGDLDSP